MDRFYQGNLIYGFRHLALLYKRSHDDTVSFYNSNYAVLIVLTVLLPCFVLITMCACCMACLGSIANIIGSNGGMMGLRRTHSPEPAASNQMV